MNFPQNKKTLVIIGAGPKAIAVAVKAKVLQEFCFAVDHVILIEKNSVAAHWSGDFGYTNGQMKLGTPPEKDVVFPIEINVGDNVLNARIRERLLHFSWISFLVHTHRYSDWIDQGRYAPSHQLWASYLQWVTKQLNPFITIVQAKVISIDLTSNENRWKLTLESAKTNWSIEADRLMLTGPGQTRMDFVEQPNQSFFHSIYDLETFWYALKEKKFSSSAKIAIIGSGEHAASILIALSQYGINHIDVIASKGFLSSRAENYYENQIYSDPDKNGWKEIALSDRLDFIKRTDLGVFSLQAMSTLVDNIKPKIIPGRVVNVKCINHELSLTLVYHHKKIIRMYDQVILATGFDQIGWIKSLMTQKVQKALTCVLASSLTQQAIAAKIDSDLSVKDMRPYLHWPMLAGLMQGPGFANLSCLGRLSDRLITTFVYRQTPHLNQRIIPFLQEARC